MTVAKITNRAVKLLCVLWTYLGAVLVSGAGCGGPQLSEVQVPDGGIELRYNLAPNRLYQGKIRARTQMNTQLGAFAVSTAFALHMRVAQAHGDPLIRATLREIEITTITPTGGGPAAQLARKLEGIEVRFNLDDRGRATNVPEAPPDLAPGLRAIVEQLTGAVLDGLVRVPAGALTKGAAFAASGVRDGPKMRSWGSGKLERMVYDPSRGESLANLQLRLETEAQTEAQGIKVKITSTEHVDVLFSIAGGFPARVERDATGSVGGAVDVVSHVEAEWTMPPAAGPPSRGTDPSRPARRPQCCVRRAVPKSHGAAPLTAPVRRNIR